MPQSQVVHHRILSAIACAAATVATASTALAGATSVTGDVRRDLIRRAQVRFPTEISTADIRLGPQDGRGFQPDETVSCTFVTRPQTGHSPKFHCLLSDGSVVKVKYGAGNGEVYAQVMASRLLWALGFAADAQYPVTVVCDRCSADPWTNPDVRKATQTFYPAIIERPHVGKVIESREGSGWSWPELAMVDEATGGASLAERDALTLLAVLMQHTDSKPDQQRLVCINPTAGTMCAVSLLYLHDVGLTFGAANAFNRSSIGAANLRRWAEEPVWKHRERCVGNLKKSNTGSLDNPRISEAGRALLASLLVQLTDQQLWDLFDVGRVTLRQPATTIDDWVRAFKHKRDDIVDQRCPS